MTALEATGRQLDGQVALFQGSIRNNEQNVARIREELSQQEGRSSGIAQQIAGSRKRIAAIDEELQLLRRTLEETGGESSLAANAEGITKQYLELRSRQSALQADIAGRQADLAALEESVRQAQSRMEDIQADLDAGRRRQDQAQQAMDACQKGAAVRPGPGPDLDQRHGRLPAAPVRAAAAPGRPAGAAAPGDQPVGLRLQGQGLPGHGAGF